MNSASTKGGIAHTALYVRRRSEGIEVVHQHSGPKPIRGTLIRFGGRWLGDECSPQRADGYHKSDVSSKNTGREGITPEDDADNYYVVELRPRAKPPNKSEYFDAQIPNRISLLK